MKFIFRLFLTVILLGVLAACGIGFYTYMHRGELVEGAITEATGSASAGSVAGKIAKGEDLDDAEIQELLGVDDEAYAKFKRAADRVGVNVNDGNEVKKIIEDNSDKLGDLQSVADGLRSGSMTLDDAAEYLSQNLKLR